MGYRHNTEEVLDAAIEVARDQGLAELTFRSTGRRLGIADRTVVYYFPTKTDLLAAVLHRSTSRLVVLLTPEIGDERAPAEELLAASWAALRRPEAQPWIKLYVEALGLAVRGTEPYTSIATELTTTWTSWFAAHILPDSTTEQDEAKDRAAGLLATLDGLLLLHTTVGPDLALSAARGLGVSLS
ncbi:MAG: TetR/AcrR family transcriptional regulator [Ornithinimicrobium sp.]